MPTAPGLHFAGCGPRDSYCVGRLAYNLVMVCVYIAGECNLAVACVSRGVGTGF